MVATCAHIFLYCGYSYSEAIDEETVLHHTPLYRQSDTHADDRKLVSLQTPVARLRNLLIEGRIVILLRVVNIIRDLTMYPSSVQLRILLDVGQSPALSGPAAPLAACVQRISCNFLSYVNAMSPELNSVDKANKNKLLRQHPLRDRKLISD